jgi:4-amino-4-deoxy-L-arabinose transferase-like glycosyltransferase
MSTQTRTIELHPYKCAAGVLLALFVVLASIYSVVTPIWEAPDEPSHYAYAAYLRQQFALPVQTVNGMDMAHHPPLYYALAAIMMLPADLNDPSGAFKLNPNFIWQGHGGMESNASFHSTAETFPYTGIALAVHLGRALSIVIATLTVAFVIAIGWHIFPARPTIGLFAGALTALNPQFLFISAAMMNDNLLILGATGTLWQALRAAGNPQQGRQWLYLGLWVSVAVLSKLNGFVFGFIAGLALIACAIHHRSLKMALRGGIIMGAVIGVLTGWWFIRNLSLYQDPLGMSMYYIRRADMLRTTPMQWNDLLDMFNAQLRSFFGVFGWMTVGMPDWFYEASHILLLAGIVGIIVTILTGKSKHLTRYQVFALLFLAAAIVVDELVMIVDVNRTGASQYQGRYMFPIIGPLMILAAYGLLSLVPRRFSTYLSAGMSVVIASIALTTPFNVIAPAYTMVTLPKTSVWFQPYPTDATFGNMFALRAYQTNDPSGETLAVKLYWEALQKPNQNYSVFVHLIDAQGQMVAQQDQAPGNGPGYLPLQWSKGDIVADEWQINLPLPLSAGKYQLRVGMYDPNTGNRLPVWAKGQSIGDFIVLTLSSPTVPVPSVWSPPSPQPRP